MNVMIPIDSIMALYSAYIDKSRAPPIHVKSIQDYVKNLQGQSVAQFFNEFGMEMAGGLMRIDVRLHGWSDFIQHLKTDFNGDPPSPAREILKPYSSMRGFS